MNNLLYDKIKNYVSGGAVPFHMPGHKRNTEQLALLLPYDIDITEIDGFDNLHDMQGILKEKSESASKVFGVKNSYFLINGSTGGILSAIYSQTRRGDKVLVSRNCHKAVFNAIEIGGLSAIYAMPKFSERDNINGEIEACEIERLLRVNDGVKCVVITSPTYEGVVSDIQSIANICHKYNCLLIVDEAHGAHLGFDCAFPQSARSLGADIVINSLHKTLPAMTQCAIIHICSERVDKARFEKALSMFETSSPSYVLLCSIDYCVDLLKECKKELFVNYNANLDWFYNKAGELKNVQVLNLKGQPFAFDFDKSKLIIKAKHISGSALADILRKCYNIEVEMATSAYVLAMTSICDKRENFVLLLNALSDIDNKLNDKVAINELNIDNAINDNTINDNADFSGKFILPSKKYEICDAVEIKGELSDLQDCKGKVALEYVWVYPPGVPLIVPGEIVSQDFINQINVLSASGLDIRSNYKKAPIQIYVK